MPFLGTIVNFFVVLICGLVGLLIKKGIPIRVCETLKQAMGVCVVYIGIEGALEAVPKVGIGFISDGLLKILVMVISLALGAFIGEVIRIDEIVSSIGDKLEKRFVKGEGKGKFAEGFIYCSTLFCVGAMTINGCFADALGDPDILIAKSVIDGIVCLVASSTLGIGCAASAFFVLLYQGSLTLIGLFVADYIPAEAISYMSATGSLVVILIGLNMLGVSKAKPENMIPALFIPALLWPLICLLI